MNKFHLALLLIGIVLLAGCTQTNNPTEVKKVEQNKISANPQEIKTSEEKINVDIQNKTISEKDTQTETEIYKSTNSLSPDAIASSSPFQVIIKQDEMEDYWKEKNSFGKYTVDLSKKTDCNDLTGALGPSIEVGNGVWQSVNASQCRLESSDFLLSEKGAYSLRIVVTRYENIESAKSIFDSTYDSFTGKSNYENAGNQEIGNQLFFGTFTRYGYGPSGFDLIFRRNNFIVSIHTEDSSEKVKQEVLNYAFLMDERIQ